MVNISNSAAKLISSTVNEKTGTTVKKLLMPDLGKKAMATVVEYGQNNPLKKRGIDAFVKIDGATKWQAGVNKALFSGDEIILSGTSNVEKYGAITESFNSRFKEMVNLLKKYPKLTASPISNTEASYNGYAEAIRKFQG